MTPGDLVRVKGDSRKHVLLAVVDTAVRVIAFEPGSEPYWTKLQNVEAWG